MRKQILAGAFAGLLTAHATASAQAGRAFTTDFTTQEFAARRAKVYDAIGRDAVALMQGLPSVHSSAVFRQSNEFYYLTGVVAPQALVLLDGAARRTILYLPKQDTCRAATEGELLFRRSREDRESHGRRRSEVARSTARRSTDAEHRENHLCAVRAD